MLTAVVLWWADLEAINGRLKLNGAAKHMVSGVPSCSSVLGEKLLGIRK